MKKIVAILSLVFLFSCEPSNKATETHSESKTLSPTAEAIREYKETFQWEKGFESWSKVSTTEDYNFINRNRKAKKLARSSLSIDEQRIIDTLVKKGIFGRYKQGEETFYLFNK